MASLTCSQISVIFILPETKSISLERMDKIFGEVDAVEAGEDAGDGEKVEAMVYSHQENQHHTIVSGEDKKVVTEDTTTKV